MIYKQPSGELSVLCWCSWRARSDSNRQHPASKAGTLFYPIEVRALLKDETALVYLWQVPLDRSKQLV